MGNGDELWPVGVGVSREERDLLSRVGRNTGYKGRLFPFTSGFGAEISSETEQDGVLECKESGSEIRQVRRSLWAGQWAQLTVPGSISSSSQSSMVPSILINFGSDGSVVIRSMVSGPNGFFMHGRIVAHP